jgi:hypothetical protein
MFPQEIENINSAKYLSSIGFMKACDDNQIIHYIDPFRISIDWNKLFNTGKNNSCIYVKMANVYEFIQNIDNIPFNFILITGDGDETFPNDILSIEMFLKIINNNKIIHWYSTNCDETLHPKFSVIPIGLNYHCDALWKNISVKNQESILENIRIQSLPVPERIKKCYSNFHFSLYNNKFGNPRKEAIEKISSECVYYEPEKITTEQTWINQSKYAFIISPHGNGLDCHRTWEGLILGCICIVKTSVLDPLYTDLPVIIVDDWDDINDSLLENYIKYFKTANFNYDKLTLKYWNDKIHTLI